MIGVLDYIRTYAPALYARTRYRTIEISARLARIQAERAEASRHAHVVEVVRESLFDGPNARAPETARCFVLAFEVLDNLAHDLIRYTVRDHEPMQCVVSADREGDLLEFYEPVTDPLLRRALAARAATPTMAARPDRPRWMTDRVREWQTSLPFAANLSPPVWIPTQLVQLLEILRDSFPRHRLVASDFSSLPDTIEGRDGPVVQTRYKGQTVRRRSTDRAERVDRGDDVPCLAGLL